MKHSPEPWRNVTHYDPEKGRELPTPYIVDNRSRNVAAALLGAISDEEHEANAARIVSCVNACQGINPEAVPELLKALKALSPMWDNDSPLLTIYADEITAARAAINKAEGGRSPMSLDPRFAAYRKGIAIGDALERVASHQRMAAVMRTRAIIDEAQAERLNGLRTLGNPVATAFWYGKRLDYAHGWEMQTKLDINHALAEAHRTLNKLTFTEKRR